MSVLGLFVREILLEAERDAKYLQKINKKGFWDQAIIDRIKSLPDNDFPANDRKRFVKWFANELQRMLHGSDSAQQRDVKYFVDAGALALRPIDEIAIDIEYCLYHVTDWINATENSDYLDMSFYDASSKSFEWHDEIANNPQEDVEMDEGDIINHTFSDGWTIREVSPGGCDAEGQAMGHCVAGYKTAIRRGSSKIYSLRDPQNKPHVTFEIDPRSNKVRQVQGKGNKPPLPKYAKRVGEWLRLRGFEIWSTEQIRERVEWTVSDAIDNWEDGKDYPTEDTIERLLEDFQWMTINPEKIGSIILWLHSIRRQLLNGAKKIHPGYMQRIEKNISEIEGYG